MDREQRPAGMTFGEHESLEKTESTLSQNQSALYPANISYLAHGIPDRETLLHTP